MKNIIHFSIEKDKDDRYIASARDFAIVTQGETFEELMKNVREATELHFEDAPEDTKLISKSPSIFVDFEVPISLNV